MHENRAAPLCLFPTARPHLRVDHVRELQVRAIVAEVHLQGEGLLILGDALLRDEGVRGRLRVEWSGLIDQGREREGT